METITQKRRRYQKDSTPSSDIITLIHLVRQNPTLYNYKLQPNQRKRVDILNGWAHIAKQIGNKYTVEECRRKWKNLRDTYHQYRLRKSKIGDGLSKWRYAKHMDFLSNVYQPKLKCHRTQSYADIITVTQDNLLNEITEKHEHDDDDEAVISQSIVHSDILSVNDPDTFILTSYEDVSHDNDVTNDNPNMLSSHHDNSMDGCVEFVKNEHSASLDADGANGGDVDYEEVCLYEDAGTASVDCEAIIRNNNNGGDSVHSDEGKYQYIDTNDFCMSSINAEPRSHYSSSNSSVIGSSAGHMRNVSVSISQNLHQGLQGIPSTSLVSNNTAANVTTSSINIHGLPELTIASALNNSIISTYSDSSQKRGDNQSSNSLISQGSIIAIPADSKLNGIDHPLQTIATTALNQSMHQREECDLFFDFLKKKLQRFPPEEITSIQVEFLNCVLRREAENAHKNITQQICANGDCGGTSNSNSNSNSINAI